MTWHPKNTPEEICRAVLRWLHKVGLGAFLSIGDAEYNPGQLVWFVPLHTADNHDIGVAVVVPGFPPSVSLLHGDTENLRRRLGRKAAQRVDPRQLSLPDAHIEVCYE